MSDAGPGRQANVRPWAGRHPARWAVVALCVCQLAALSLLWNQWWNTPPAGLPSWLPPAASALLAAWAVSQWPAWWRAAGYRFTGMVPGSGAAAMPGERARPRLRATAPDGVEHVAAVRDSWKLGEAVTLLALSAESGRVPRVLAVTAWEGRPAECRALQRAVRVRER